MKRIFLTSGLVLCMACPAFATASWDGQTGNVPPLNDGCTQPNLGVYSGPTTLKAIWQSNFYEIKLNSNIGESTATGGATSAAPTPLYSVPGQNTVWTGKNDNDDLTGLTAVGASPITTAATGINVNYALDYNLPNSHVNSDLTTNTATSAQARRPFLGFYDSLQTGAAQMIDASGNLTSGGGSAASSANADQTWYAQWDTATPTITGTLALPGYDFDGWNTAADGTGSIPGAIGQNTPVYAQWTAHTGTLTYNCGTQPGTTEGSGTAPAGGTLTYDQSFTIATTPGSCVYEGYTFAGWDCNYDLASGAASDAGTITYAATDGTITSGNAGIYHVVADNAAITCSAKWTAKTIGTITWTDPDGGNQITDGSSSCTYDGEIVLPTTPQRTGYQFGGWEVVPQTSQQ